MRGKYDFSPIILDVEERYMEYRKSGKNRDEAIAAIEAEESEAIMDSEDHVAIALGLAFALCKKKELTEVVYFKAIDAIIKFKNVLEANDHRRSFLDAAERYLRNPVLYGLEATYRRRTPYTPDWKTGDVFSHVLTHPRSKSLGIENWTILFYKVGEYMHGRYPIQLMYVCLCPPGKLPSTSQELQELGFLRMMNHNDKWDYLAQILIKSAKDEQSYQLKRIGNFPGVVPPADRTEENPETAMPLFGIMEQGNTRPDYEDQICRIYRSIRRWTN